jgi:hypothetical protein
MEFLSSSKLEILNRGNQPTFCNAVRQEALDVTLGSCGLLDRIADWGVSVEPSLSDHRHILFTLQGSVPAPLIRNPRGTNWDSFQRDLRRGLEGGPQMSMQDEVGIALATHWLQQALISAYEDKCPPARKGKRPLRWMQELQSLRREV